MIELDQFVADMAASVDHIKATERQKEVFKASLRFAISFARGRAAARATLSPAERTDVEKTGESQ